MSKQYIHVFRVYTKLFVNSKCAQILFLLGLIFFGAILGDAFGPFRLREAIPEQGVLHGLEVSRLQGSTTVDSTKKTAGASPQQLAISQEIVSLSVSAMRPPLNKVYKPSRSLPVLFVKPAVAVSSPETTLRQIHNTMRTPAHQIFRSLPVSSSLPRIDRKNSSGLEHRIKLSQDQVAWFVAALCSTLLVPAVATVAATVPSAAIQFLPMGITVVAVTMFASKLYDFTTHFYGAMQRFFCKQWHRNRHKAKE